MSTYFVIITQINSLRINTWYKSEYSTWNGFSLEKSGSVFDLYCSMIYFLRCCRCDTVDESFFKNVFYFVRWAHQKQNLLVFIVALLYVCFCILHSVRLSDLFSFFFSSLKKSVLHMKYWQTQRRRSFMIAMESRVCGREEAVGPAWMISSLTFSVEDCLGSWGDRAEDAMEAGGEEMIWCTLWSKYYFDSIWVL